jgi:hypothetical protein
MNTKFKTALVGVVVAMGLASSGALAQGGDATVPENSQMTRDGGMANGQMMAMMNDPEMRGQMTAMMENCNRMMERMNNSPPPTERPERPHQKR